MKQKIIARVKRERCGDELYKKLKKELQVLRDYIHSRNLEWDLLSYYKEVEKNKSE